LRLPQPGGPGPHIYILQEQRDPYTRTSPGISLFEIVYSYINSVGTLQGIHGVIINEC
jgi:hypothetical protein